MGKFIHYKLSLGLQEKTLDVIIRFQLFTTDYTLDGPLNRIEFTFKYTNSMK